MYKVLMVDESREGREHIRYLLEQEAKLFTMGEASSAAEALDLLSLDSYDFLMTDVALAPDLVGQARKRFPHLPVLIFCTYEDFSKAEREERHGSVHVCLKPVERENLVSLMASLSQNTLGRAGREDALVVRNRHLLSEYLYDRERNLPEGADASIWEKWHRAILIESAQPFFDAPNTDFAFKMERELHRPFFYLNLNARQSLLLFDEVYCDYALIGKHIYVYLKRKNAARFFVAVSRQFSSYRELKDILSGLEAQMGEQYYHLDVHVFTSEEEKAKYVSEEAQDSELIQQISEDISRKDVGLLKKHFGFLVDKYQKQSQFSAMYVKFVFSNVLQELFQEPDFARESLLEKKIDLLYSYSDMGRILEVTRQAINEYESFLERRMESALGKVRQVMEEISAHPGRNESLEEAAQRQGIPAGYFHYLFLKEAGMCLPRFQHVKRLERARELLLKGVPPRQVCQMMGFVHLTYFQRAYEEYTGMPPKAVRQD